MAFLQALVVFSCVHLQKKKEIFTLKAITDIMHNLTWRAIANKHSIIRPFFHINSMLLEGGGKNFPGGIIKVDFVRVNRFGRVLSSGRGG